MRLNNVVYSYLFFALFVFNALALLSSEFMQTFKQLFTLLANNGGVYDIFSCILLCLAFVTLFSMPLKIYKRRFVLGRTALFITTCLALVLLCVICMLFYRLWNTFFIKQSLDILFNDETIILTWQSYLMSFEFTFSLVCWIFLIILPLTYKAVSLTINIQHRIGKSMLILEPSITTILIIMNANIFHPYFSSLPSRYIDFAFFVIANILLIYVLLRNQKLFGFYEYVNLVLLAISIFYTVLCSKSVLSGTFFNAQLTLYILGICSWCNEWLYNQEIVHEKITS